MTGRGNTHLCCSVDSDTGSSHLTAFHERLLLKRACCPLPDPEEMARAPLCLWLHRLMPPQLDTMIPTGGRYVFTFRILVLLLEENSQTSPEISNPKGTYIANPAGTDTTSYLSHTQSCVSCSIVSSKLDRKNATSSCDIERREVCAGSSSP